MKNLAQLHKYIIANTVITGVADIKLPKFTAIVFLAQPSEVRALARARKMFSDLRKTDGELTAYSYDSKAGQKILQTAVAEANAERPAGDDYVYTTERELLRYAVIDQKYRALELKRKQKAKAKVKENTENFIALQNAVGDNAVAVASMSQPKRKAVSVRDRRDREALVTKIETKPRKANPTMSKDESYDRLAKLIADLKNVLNGI